MLISKGPPRKTQQKGQERHPNELPVPQPEPLFIETRKCREGGAHQYTERKCPRDRVRGEAEELR